MNDARLRLKKRLEKALAPFLFDELNKKNMDAMKEVVLHVLRDSVRVIKGKDGRSINIDLGKISTISIQRVTQDG